MILLTVGTSEYSFRRCLQLVDETCIKLGLKEELVAQVGVETYNFTYPHVSICKELAFGKLKDNIKRARAVIVHGGAGSYLMSVMYARVKPYIFPRYKQFNEHVDDHQLQFASYVGKCGRAVLHDHGEGLVKYLKNPPTSSWRGDQLRTSKLVTNLIAYTESV